MNRHSESTERSSGHGVNKALVYCRWGPDGLAPMYRTQAHQVFNPHIPLLSEGLHWGTWPNVVPERKSRDPGFPRTVVTSNV